MFKLIGHLLTRSQAWRISHAGNLRNLFLGFGDYLDGLRLWVDRVWLDAFPEHTRELDAWDRMFGLPSEGRDISLRRQRLAGAWRQTGGATPEYLSEILHWAGFNNLYVYHFWCGVSSTTGIPISRDPNAYKALGAYILREITTLGEYVETGTATALADPTTWPFFMYVGPLPLEDGPAEVPAYRRRELETMINKIKPAQLWTVMNVDYI